VTPYYADSWLTVYEGDCRAVMAAMEPESVHCVVTSPPYWGLRDYGTPGQLGLEPTPEEYVANMVAVFREVRRVLRDDGTVWLNLGDTYAANRAYQVPDSKHRDVGNTRGMTVSRRRDNAIIPRSDLRVEGLKPKDLVGIPWRVAFALQADGWYLRSDIIWSKPNPMPESVTDRPTKAHEYLFLLSKSPRYYFDADAVAEAVTDTTVERLSQAGLASQRGSDRVPGKTNGPMKAVGSLTPVEALQVALDMGIEADVTDYIARHNPTWEERKAAGATAGNLNTRPDIYQNAVHGEGLPHDLGTPGTRNIRSVWTVATQPYPGAHFATFPEALVEPCVKAGSPHLGTVLDPFAGSGTTGRVAQRLGRRAVLIDLNGEYLRQAMDRNADIPLGLGA
jgi:DNA modification methylase